VEVEVDLGLNVAVEAPSVEVEAEVEVPRVEVEVEVEAPKLGLNVGLPSVEAEAEVDSPSVEVGVEVEAPKLGLNTEAPSEVKADVELQAHASVTLVSANSGVGPSLSLLNPRPDQKMVEKIVQALNTADDGVLSVYEIKVLFSKLGDIPMEQIPDDHAEVVAFAGLAPDALVSKLCTNVSKVQVESFYQAMFGEAALQIAIADNAQSHCDDEISAADIALRTEAADLAGIDCSKLPPIPLLKSTVKHLHGILASERTGKIQAEDLIRACMIYDDRVPLEGIQDTFAAVEGENGMDEKRFYLWLILMFGDCSEDEFISGTAEFGEAAESAHINHR